MPKPQSKPQGKPKKPTKPQTNASSYVGRFAAPEAKQPPRKPESPKPHNIKKRKVKTAATVTKSFLIGMCVGTVPYAKIMGEQNEWLYLIPVVPLILYCICRMCQDLKGWYENDDEL